MKILCAYSGIEFTCDHFPASLYSREACHPIFYLPQKKLISYLGKWSSGELTPVDSYLLFLATLKSSDLVEFRVPAIITPSTQKIVAQNMETLVKTVIKLNTVVNPSVMFPHFVITPETKTLENVKYWIQNWIDSYQEFLDGYIDTNTAQRVIQKEHALERLIKSPHKPIASYASQIADWAADAADFPVFQTINRLTGKQSTCSDYWKMIIICCASEEKLFSINKEDLDELLEHCETEISYGTIFSNALFSMLRKAKDKQKNFLGLGDLDIGDTIYKILDANDTVEVANMKSIMQSAPLDIPTPEQYPNKFAYMKAKLRYDMAKKYSQKKD